MIINYKKFLLLCLFFTPALAMDIEQAKLRVTSELRQALEDGDTEKAASLLDENIIGVDHRYEHGNTALYLAVRGRHLELVRLLLSRHANVNLAGMDGDTPLHIIATLDDPQGIAELLIQVGAEVNRPNNDGATPLHGAANFGNIRLAEVLLRHGANFRQPNRWGIWPYFSISARSVGEMIPLFLRYGVCSNDRFIKNNPHIMGALAEHVPNKLSLACIFGDVERVKELLGISASPNDFILDSLEKVGRLVYQLFNTNNPRRHFTPLHWAAAQGHAEIVKLLLDYGFNAQVLDEHGDTPLHVAARNGHAALISLLLRAQPALLNAQNNQGETPLHVAARRRGNIPVLQALLSAEARVDITNRDGHTAWGVARHHNQEETICFLENHAAQTVLWRVNQAGRNEGRLGNLPPEVVHTVMGFVMGNVAPNNQDNSHL